MDIKQIVTIDNDILNGQPVFSGTRVPIESLFDHLEARVSLDEFLDDFPTVSKEQAILYGANKIIATGYQLSQKIKTSDRTSGDK